MRRDPGDLSMALYHRVAVGECFGSLASSYAQCMVECIGFAAASHMLLGRRDNGGVGIITVSMQVEQPDLRDPKCATFDGSGFWCIK